MLWYGRPARHLAVIGVTGTDGKTTTVNLIAHLLAHAGRRVGVSSSAVFQVGDHRWSNDSHLTMPGRFALQKLLRQIVNAGCQYAVIEVSSEGLRQYRHLGIDFDVAVLTNITPEHIEAHGSFEKYQRTKEQLFAKIIKGGDKHIGDRVIPKVTVVNLDDPSAPRFLEFWAEEHYGVTLGQSQLVPDAIGEKLQVLKADNIRFEASASSFWVNGQEFVLPMPGQFNVANALEAMAVGRALGLSWPELANGLASFPGVAGRMEEVPSHHPWRVVVDYALTPNALRQLYSSLRQSGAKRIIAVFGAAGGGRDKWKRPELGKIADECCQQIILTTDDPYDEDPQKIAEEIQRGIVTQREVHIILDRRQAIIRAMQLAQPGDVIAITGMGSESSMMVKGKRVPWSDASVVREELQRLP